MSRKTILAALCAVLLLLLGGWVLRSLQNQPQEAEIDPLHYAAPTYTSVWPENDFTSSIFPPEEGQVSYTRSAPDSDLFEISLTGISKAASDAYVAALQDAGFQEIGGDSNDVSTGVLLGKAGLALSIAYSGDSLGILIIRDPDWNAASFSW